MWWTIYTDLERVIASTRCMTMQNLFCTSWPLDASSSSVCLVLMYCDPPIATKPAIRAEQAVLAASKTTKDTKINLNNAIFSVRVLRPRHATVTPKANSSPGPSARLRQATAQQGVHAEYMTGWRGGRGGGYDVFLGWKFIPSVFFWVKRSVTYLFRC